MFRGPGCAESAGWSDSGGPWWPAGRFEELGPTGFPGPVSGQVQGDFPCRGRDPGGDGDEFSADGAASCFAQVGAGEGADGAREVEGDGRQDQPGRVGGELSRGQVRQGTVFEVRVDLLDDGVLAVGFVCGDGVQGAGGEEGVEAVGVEQGLLPCDFFGVQFRDPAYDQAPLDAFGLLRPTNAVKTVSATSAEEIHAPLVSSRTASVYWIVVQAFS